MIKVIIAEDDFRVANIHEEFLTKMDGIEVKGKALTGNETLHHVAETDVDLLLLDIYLPDYLGLDLIQKAREINPYLDIIVITAATDKELLESSLRKGVVNYLIKPVEIDHFKEVINNYKMRNTMLQQKDEIDQGMLNELFATTRKSNSQKEQAMLPKGIDTITLQKVKDYLSAEEKYWTADEMGKQIGASRTTARRYLEYLVSTDYAEVEQEYGVIGRPERKYIISPNP
ncbi:transcriptional regulator [Lentibacillus kapialis]|uniref:Transcriptional regulator n=1 Tax=Lentibacillus kapialis TaxID=340214 RepID=A0A917PXU4_9BACI|nr:response regulator [Lentibacillus kapialis]GGJ99315.1 transcriptional regulator [Lentibacillus kapialis]